LNDGNKLQDYAGKDYFSFSGNSDILTVSCWTWSYHVKSLYRLYSSSPIMTAVKFQVIGLPHLGFQTLGGGAEITPVPCRRKPQSISSLHSGQLRRDRRQKSLAPHQRNRDVCRFSLKQFFQCRWRIQSPVWVYRPAFQSGRHNAAATIVLWDFSSSG